MFLQSYLKYDRSSTSGAFIRERGSMRVLLPPRPQTIWRPNSRQLEQVVQNTYRTRQNGTFLQLYYSSSGWKAREGCAPPPPGIIPVYALLSPFRCVKSQLDIEERGGESILLFTQRVSNVRTFITTALICQPPVPYQIAPIQPLSPTRYHQSNPITLRKYCYDYATS